MHSYHWVRWGGVLVSVVKLDKKWSHLQEGNFSWGSICGGLDRNGPHGSGEPQLGMYPWWFG